ncbi:MAG: Zn-dependent hydrolase, partial [Gammaproteobacteria bacterium]
ESAALHDKHDPYTVLRRDSWGELETVPYRQAYRRDLVRAARLLGRAAAASPEPAFTRYLTLRARSLITDDYVSSDIAWTGLRDNTLDVVIGPVVFHEDALLGYKSAFAGWVLIRDKTWAHRLNLMTELLPQLQDDLPVASLYRSEKPVVDAPPDAYDVVLYAGAANAGRKAVAINLPADVRVSAQFGTRRLHFRNVMRAEFDHIVRPVAAQMIVPDQQAHVNFEAYFGHTMMREMAHELGPRTTVHERGSLREALREHHELLEEGKAEILGLNILDWLDRRQQLSGPSMTDYLVTSVATTLRAIRSGDTNPQAIADIIRFNFLVGLDAISRDRASGRYRVHPQRMREAVMALASQLLVLQGNGDYAGAANLVRDLGYLTTELQMDLQRLTKARVPVDLMFDQGLDVLGLQ